MQPISIQTIFDRKAGSKKNGSGLIEIRAYQGRKYKYFSTGIRVLPKQWSKKLNAIHKHPDELALNRLIESYISELRKQINQFIDRKGICTLNDLTSQKSSSTVLEFFDKRLKRSSLKEATIKSKTTTYNHFKDFLGKRRIVFQELNLDIIESFDSYLKGLEMEQPTIHKNHKNLKAMINEAKRYGMMNVSDNPYAYFQVARGTSAEREFLSTSELAKLEDLSYTPQEWHKERVRKLFLLSVYTGLRFSDIHLLNKDNFKETDRGLELNFKSQKTGKNLSMSLFNLWPSKGIKRTRPEQLSIDLFLKSSELDQIAIKQLSNQYTNRLLKDIAYEAKIHKNITFHVARHTFGTHMATKIDNVRLLQHLMDHSNINVTMIYIHLSKKLINKELENIEW